MISLEFRMAVDTSAWDQSFVDGAGDNVTHPADGGVRDTRHGLNLNSRNDLDESDTRRDRRMPRHVTPAETTANHGRCQFVTECHQPMAPDSAPRQTRGGTSPGARHAFGRGGDARHHGSRAELLAMSNVATWLDGLKPFKSSSLPLNRSFSGSLSICSDSSTTTTATFDVRTPETDNQNRPVVVRIAPDLTPDVCSRAGDPLLPVCDPDRLRIVYARLRTSGFYLGRMSMEDARRRLTGFPVGTFLLRDSSDFRFLFSLSVQTPRGTTSIRIRHDSGGHFRLDSSNPDPVHRTPTFDCVLLLVCHYIRRRDDDATGRRGSDDPSHFHHGCSSSYVLREPTGRCDTPGLIRRPLETTPAALAHLCRKRIHRSIGRTPRNIGRLHLNPSLKNYLADYPYDI